MSQPSPRRRRWRIIPKISFVNYAKEPAARNAFKKWFSFNRYWSGQIINIGIRHYAIVLDFRKDWIGDFISQTP